MAEPSQDLEGPDFEKGFSSDDVGGWRDVVRPRAW